MENYLKTNNVYGDGFSAILLDGPSVDLFEIAYVEYSDELHDAVWEKYNWQSLEDECGSLITYYCPKRV